MRLGVRTKVERTFFSFLRGLPSALLLQLRLTGENISAINLALICIEFFVIKLKFVKVYIMDQV